MLLAIDISNTNIKIGIYNKTAIEHRWVVSTARQRTTDAYALLLSDLMSHAGLRFTDVDAIIIAFSTATTFDVISAQGDFLGGAIAPGLLISAEALTSAASRLYRVDLTPPRSALGKNTIENLQSGIIYGHVGLVQGLIHRLLREIPGVNEADERQVKVIAHGGLAQLMAPIIPEIQHVNQYLPLEGLRLAYTRLTTS